MAAPSEAPAATTTSATKDEIVDIDPDSCELWPSSISPSEFREFYCEPVCTFRSGSDGALLDREDSRRRREERSCPDILAASEADWPDNSQLMGQSLSFDGIPCICQEPPYTEFREHYLQDNHEVEEEEEEEEEDDDEEEEEEEEPECSKMSCCEIDEEAEEATEEPEEASFTQHRDKQFNELFLASQRRQQRQRTQMPPVPPPQPPPPPAEQRSMCFLL